MKNSQPIMVVGLPRSGTTWTERVIRYGGCASIHECFKHGTNPPASMDHAFPIWDGHEAPDAYIARCAELARPRRLLFKVCDSHLPWEATRRLSGDCDCVVLLRHPLAALASWQQAGVSRVWNWVQEDANAEARRQRYQEPVIQATEEQVQLWWRRFARLREFACGRLIVAYPEILRDPQAVIQRLYAHFGLAGDASGAPKKVNQKPIAERFANWADIQRWSAPYRSSIELL